MTDPVDQDVLAQVRGWCDMSLEGVTWESEGRDLVFELTTPGGECKSLVCQWASALRIDIKRNENIGGHLLAWEIRAEDRGKAIAVTLDFASEGTISLSCTGLSIRVRGAVSRIEGERRE